MLSEIVTELVGEYIFRRCLAGYRYSLLSALGCGVGKPVDFWKGYPCYKLYFTCNDNGSLLKLGASGDFSEKEKGENFGRFKIAIDPLQIHTARQTGITYTDIPHELIVHVGFYKKEVPKTTFNRVIRAAAYYNGAFGFNYTPNGDYNGFAVEDF